jgi:hypothetical protein
MNRVWVGEADYLLEWQQEKQEQRQQQERQQKQ